MKAEWRNRIDFAPLAEALGITTDSVMAALPEADGVWRVLYTQTPTADPNEWIWSAACYTNSEGIIEVVGTAPVSPISELTSRLDAYMQMAMEKEKRDGAE